MADSHGPWLVSAAAIFFCWAGLSVGVRVWFTLGRKHSWGHADTLVVSAFAISLLHVAATFWAVHHGYGLPLRDIGEARIGGVEKALYVSQLSYVGAVGLTRVSTAFFVGQLTRHAPQVLMSRILAAVAGVWSVVGIFVVALRPDLARPWATLDGAQSLYVRWIAIEATGLAIEVALFVLPVSLIWGLQMKAEKRVLILTIFGSRLLLTPIVAVRLLYLSPGKNHDPTLTSILPHILTEGVMDYAILSTSITALKPFLEPFHAGAIVNTVGQSGSGLYSGPRPGPGLYMLSAVATDKKNNIQTTTATVRATHRNNNPQPRPKFYSSNTGGGTAVISSRGDGHRDDMDSVESNGSEQMIIRTTKEWAVRYEQE